MADHSNRNNRPPQTRSMKSNSLGCGTPDSPGSFHGRGSPGAGMANPFVNHNSGSYNHHNQRTYPRRGTYGAYGNYHSGNNHQGTGYPPNHRKKPERPQNVQALTAFMLDTWNTFTDDVAKRKEMQLTEAGLQIQDEEAKATIVSEASNAVLTPAPSFACSDQVNTPLHAPKSGQPSHQPPNRHNQSDGHRPKHEAAGSNWSVNGTGVGRQLADSGDHSNTGSLRRNQHRPTNTSSPSIPSDQPWQRGKLIKRNSPDSTLHRPTGSRNLHRPPTPSSPSVVKSQSSEVLPDGPSSPDIELLKSLTLEQSVHYEVAPKQASAASRKKTAAEGSNGPLTSDFDGLETALKEEEVDEQCDEEAVVSNGGESRNAPPPSIPSPVGVTSECPASPPSKCSSPPNPPRSVPTVPQKTIPQQQRYNGAGYHQPRRRAATTQGGSSLPATGNATTTETGSLASSSFCSLIDQVDALSSGEPYFTPDPPSSPSNTPVSHMPPSQGLPSPSLTDLDIVPAASSTA